MSRKRQLLIIVDSDTEVHVINTGKEIETVRGQVYNSVFLDEEVTELEERWLSDILTPIGGVIWRSSKQNPFSRGE